MYNAGMADPFVILAHSGYGAAHYDLMLRRGEALATWQLAQQPAEIAPGEPIPAKRLGDHRLAYLTYEGPVSGGRGEVARRDEGAYDLLAERADCWRVLFAGQHIRGTYELRRREGDEWTIERLQA